MDLWDNMKHNDIYIIVVPEWEERTKDWEPIWRNNDWKLFYHGKGKRHTHPGKVESPQKMNPKKPTQRYVKIKRVS